MYEISEKLFQSFCAAIFEIPCAFIIFTPSFSLYTLIFKKP